MAGFLEIRDWQKRSAGAFSASEGQGSSGYLAIKWLHEISLDLFLRFGKKRNQHV
jgi:hypothetical protein